MDNPAEGLNVSFFSGGSGARLGGVCLREAGLFLNCRLAIWFRGRWLDAGRCCGGRDGGGAICCCGGRDGGGAICCCGGRDGGGAICCRGVGGGG